MVNNAQEDWIIVDNTHEAIVSMDVFQEANDALSSRVRTINSNTCWKKSGNLFVFVVTVAESYRNPMGKIFICTA
jgi:hypothetical protein